MRVAHTKGKKMTIRGDVCFFSIGNLAGVWKGAIWSWGYLKSLYKRERATELPPGFDQHILGTVFHQDSGVFKL